MCELVEWRVLAPVILPTGAFLMAFPLLVKCCRILLSVFSACFKGSCPAETLINTLSHNACLDCDCIN
jgi:hypothetical protein